MRTELARRRDAILQAKAGRVPRWKQEHDLLSLMALLAAADAGSREVRRGEVTDADARSPGLPTRRSTESA